MFSIFAKKDKNYIVSFSQAQFKEATSINKDEAEDVTYCLGFTSQSKKMQKVLIREVFNPCEFEVERSVTHVSPSLEFLCRLWNTFRKENANAIMQLHWHKFSEKPEFSGIDDKCAYLFQKDAQKINPNTRIVQIVFGNNSEHFKARYLQDNNFVYFNRIEVIGPDRISVLSAEKSITNFKIEPVFEKNVLAFTRTGQERIKNTKVAVIGAGGIGSGVLYQMARVGFQNITIIDFDRITPDNCNRLYFVEKPRNVIRKLKAKFMANAFKKFNPKAKIRYFIGDAREIEALEILKESDLIIIASDNDAIRAVINSFCSQHCKPLVNVASGIFMNEQGNKIQNAGTQIQWFIPREPDFPCLNCHGSLNQKEIQEALMDDSQKENRKKAGYVVNTTLSPQPQVMPLNGVGISVAMWQICCWVTGIKKPEPWTYYDAMQNKIIPMKVKQNPECSVCGLNEMSILAIGDYKVRLKDEREK